MLVSSINLLIKEDYPELFKKKAEGGHEDYGMLLNFQGLGSALAFGFGTGSEMHVDPGDSHYAHAIIFSAGTGVVWVCFPQLGLHIPVHPGQMITFPAALLSHYAWYIEGTGERLLFNFFTDDTSAAKATRKYDLDHSVNHPILSDN